MGETPPGCQEQLLKGMRPKGIPGGGHLVDWEHSLATRFGGPRAGHRSNWAAHPWKRMAVPEPTAWRGSSGRGGGVSTRRCRSDPTCLPSQEWLRPLCFCSAGLTSACRTWEQDRLEGRPGFAGDGLQRAGALGLAVTVPPSPGPWNVAGASRRRAVQRPRSPRCGCGRRW